MSEWKRGFPKERGDYWYWIATPGWIKCVYLMTATLVTTVTRCDGDDTEIGEEILFYGDGTRLFFKDKPPESEFWHMPVEIPEPPEDA